MKNVRLIFVLLLIVNCTADLPDVEASPESLNPQTQNCINDLPNVILTNNGTHSFDVAIYGEDYSELFAQNIAESADSGWIELSDYNVIVVASSPIANGQKIQLSLEDCDSIEIEIDTNNTLTAYGE